MLVIKRYSFFLFLFLIITLPSLKCQTDSIYTPSKTEQFVRSLALDTACVKDETSDFQVRNFIIPTAIIGYGFGLHYIPELKKFDRKVRNNIEKNVRFKTHIDDVLLLVPIASVYALDWCNVPARHSFKDRAIVTATSFGMGLGATLLSKEVTGRWRPDLSAENSFPSGHATTAFIGAHILFKEYGNVSPWIPISGYTLATGVSFLRIVNNRHWFSDVIVGAGFGILSVEISYLLLPYLSKVFTFGSNKTNMLTLSPNIGRDWVGVGLSVKL